MIELVNKFVTNLSRISVMIIVKDFALFLVHNYVNNEISSDFYTKFSDQIGKSHTSVLNASPDLVI